MLTSELAGATEFADVFVVEYNRGRIFGRWLLITQFNAIISGA